MEKIRYCILNVLCLVAGN